MNGNCFLMNDKSFFVNLTGRYFTDYVSRKVSKNTYLLVAYQVYKHYNITILVAI